MRKFYSPSKQELAVGNVEQAIWNDVGVVRSFPRRRAKAND